MLFVCHETNKYACYWVQFTWVALTPMLQWPRPFPCYCLGRFVRKIHPLQSVFVFNPSNAFYCIQYCTTRHHTYISFDSTNLRYSHRSSLSSYNLATFSTTCSPAVCLLHTCYSLNASTCCHLQPATRFHPPTPSPLISAIEGSVRSIVLASVELRGLAMYCSRTSHLFPC